MGNPIATFFDLGDTLVIPQCGTGGALAALQPLPFVTEVLDRVRSDGTVAAPDRLGVMSNTPATATTASMKKLLAQVSFHPLHRSRVAADPVSSRTSKGVSDV